MQNSWWTKAEQMDTDQKRFIALDSDGKHLLVGPPGCGKTNLLVMRARYIYGSGLKNILFLTFTRSLQDFIRTGVSEKKYLKAEQIQTFKHWALSHCGTYAQDQMSEYDRDASFEDQRTQILDILKVANKRVEGRNLYDAILIDEVQDLMIDEVKILMQLSDRITVAGDTKQMIYETGQTVQEIKQLGFIETALKFHYRIGHAISTVADKALQPQNVNQRLYVNSQYREDEMKSRADLHECTDRQSQFDLMYDVIKLQLRSYPNEGIGIIVPKKLLVAELQARFLKTDLAEHVAYHTEDGEGNTFVSGKSIHILPIKSAKGVEFRVVHLYGLEELKYPQHRRELIFVAVTRAKTALDGYYSGKILASVESAFSKPIAPPALEDLF